MVVVKTIIAVYEMQLDWYAKLPIIAINCNFLRKLPCGSSTQHWETTG